MAIKKSAVKDLTNGSPVKLILGFALPLLLGMLFQQFYSMVDTIIVGKFLGAKALAAVGSTGSINFMIVGFCMGVCNGFAIPVAQMFGAGDRKALCRYVGNGAVLAGLLSVTMTVLVCIWCRDILILMKTPSDILDGAYAYIFVIFLGIPLMVLYNQTSAIMRSLGDSRSPLIFLGISSVLNIVLDLLLVRPMGVAGTAWATIIAQGVSGFLCLFYMKKKFTILTFTREDWKLHKHYVINLCNMGIPMGLQYSITAIGSVYSVVILGVMFLWSRQISLLFVDASETVILDQARQMLLINMVFYIPLTLVNVVRFTVQGMGFSKFAILAGVCEMIGRSVVAFFLVPYFGYTAVCFASPVAWILADLFLVPAYLYCAKALRSLFEKNAQMM